MRTLFYVSEDRWNGPTRAVMSAAQGLMKRGHQVTVACSSRSAARRRGELLGMDLATIDLRASSLGSSWDIRRVLRDRFIEVVFVTSERDHLIVSSAMRFAERGAVIRRIQSFENCEVRRRGRVAARFAASGLLFSTDREAKDARLPGWVIPSNFAPLGVDAAGYDELQPVSRVELGAPSEDGILIACSYDPSGRLRIATLFRALAVLAPRHPQLHVVVYGPGSTSDELRMHASALGVGPIVSFIGEPDDELSIVRTADVGWVASSDDAGAFSCLDFMAMRTPVITDRCRIGQHFVADRITGLLLAPGDPAHTASAISAFLGDHGRRAAMGNAARTRVQREFPESAMIDGFERAGEAGCNRTRWILR